MLVLQHDYPMISLTRLRGRVILDIRVVEGMEGVLESEEAMDGEFAEEEDMTGDLAMELEVEA